jgi:hypothetical protein
MTVQRFRTIDEMAVAPILVAPGDGFERFLRHCARYWTIAPRTYPRGVFRFRSLADAQAARERAAEQPNPEVGREAGQSGHRSPRRPD